MLNRISGIVLYGKELDCVLKKSRIGEYEINSYEETAT